MSATMTDDEDEDARSSVAKDNEPIDPDSGSGADEEQSEKELVNLHY